MTAVANKDNSETADINPPRPGQRLHAARVAADLDLAKLAAQMHLRQETLHAVEADDYDRLPTRVFVRGYYRNYARLVGLPENEILAELDEAWPDESEDLSIRPVGSQIKPEVRSSHSLVRLVTWLIVLGSMVLFVVWWVGYLQWQDQSLPTLGLGQQEETAGQERLLSLPMPEPAPEPVMVDVDQPPAVASEPEVNAPAAADDSQAVESATADVSLDQPAASPVESAPELVEDVAVEPAPEQTQAATAPRVTVSFREASWTDIRDSSRSFRLFGLIPAGATRELGGEPPYSVLLGNSAGVDISIDGKPYDQSIHAKSNVARFTLVLDDIPVE